MTVKEVIRLATPPILIRLAKGLRDGEKRAPNALTGDYASWQEALAESTGYDNALILEKTKTTLLKVKKGEAVYERDSVLFDQVQYAWPLLAGLMWVAACDGGRLNVLDFGGSLGSSYFQNRIFLSKLTNVRWNIVEQPSYVAVGKASFQDERLHFYERIPNCLAETRPNVILLSSVWQYLESPYALMETLTELPCSHLIIDRTPFWNGATDRICVQTVPAEIYPASYPIWIFSLSRFVNFLHGRWETKALFDSLDKLPAPVKTIWHGFLLERRKQEIPRP